MADNILEIWGLSPVKFKDQDYANAGPYNTKYFEDWHYSETLPYYMPADDYQQPWQKNDIIFLQFLTNFGPHQVEVYDRYMIKRLDFVAATIVSSIDSSGLHVDQASIALNTLAEGDYKIIVKSGSPLVNTLESDWFCLKELHQGSLLFEYRHDENDFNTVFETGYHPRFRVHGGFADFQPQSERVVFIDQPNNIVQLSGRSFYTEKLVIGNSFGVPKWVVQKINEIFLCSEVKIDGRQWVGVGGAKFEANRIKGIMREGWTFEIRPATKMTGNRFVNAGPASADYYVTYQVEGLLFGDLSAPASSNIIQIQSNE